ncbi:MAG TPA: 30S ribosomal protein S5 [Candidatus Nanoarchaeia archaeon]|nr:30S ribosomal protein S5 [Candidatus Nanoarchaeia archaeon]
MPKKKAIAEVKKEVVLEEKAADIPVKVIASSPLEATATEPVIEPVVDVEEVTKPVVEGQFNKDAWKPRTALGKKVKEGEITSIDQILDARERILEAEIVDAIMPNLKTELLMVGQAKGKFGGGQKRVFKQTQKKTREGNKPNFSTFAVVGNEDGYVGMGYGKAKETVPAREKAMRNAKLEIIKIRRGNGTWQDTGSEPNTIPFKVSGKCGSVKVTLMPAPRGTGLCISEECKKVLKIAGIKDIWSTIDGETKSKMNVLIALFEALKNLMQMKVMAKDEKALSLVEGQLVKVE